MLGVCLRERRAYNIGVGSFIGVDVLHFYTSTPSHPLFSIENEIGVVIV